jgi:tetratricopeptide (TPR) repeat protein
MTTNISNPEQITTNLYQAEKLWDEAHQARAAHQNASAERLYKEAITKLQAVLGDDASVAKAMDELGALYMDCGKDAEAEQQFKASVEVAEKKYYAGHASVAPALDHLADLYIRQGNFTEAEPVAVRAVEVNDKTLSGEHRCTLKSLHNLALVQMKLGKVAEAEKTLTKALKSLDTPLGPYQEFKYDLARLYEEQGKTVEAEKAYKEAIEGFEYRHNIPRLVECMESYAALLSKGDRKDEGAKLKKRADKMRELVKDCHPHGDMFPSTLLRA